MNTFLAAVEEASSAGDPAISPLAVGVIVLAVALFMLGALLAFGKGREHS